MEMTWAAQPGRPRTWSSHDLDDAVHALDAGRTRASVCEWLGCSEVALRCALRRYRPDAWLRLRRR